MMDKEYKPILDNGAFNTIHVDENGEVYLQVAVREQLDRIEARLQELVDFLWAGHDTEEGDVTE